MRSTLAKSRDDLRSASTALSVSMRHNQKLVPGLELRWLAVGTYYQSMSLGAAVNE